MAVVGLVAQTAQSLLPGAGPPRSVRERAQVGLVHFSPIHVLSHGTASVLAAKLFVAPILTAQQQTSRHALHHHFVALVLLYVFHRQLLDH